MRLHRQRSKPVDIAPGHDVTDGNAVHTHARGHEPDRHGGAQSNHEDAVELLAGDSAPPLGGDQPDPRLTFEGDRR